MGPSIHTSGGTTLCNLALTRVDYTVQQISVHCIAVNGLMDVMYIFFKLSNIRNAVKEPINNNIASKSESFNFSKPSLI
jgi:hypothetical protein